MFRSVLPGVAARTCRDGIANEGGSVRQSSHAMGMAPDVCCFLRPFKNDKQYLHKDIILRRANTIVLVAPPWKRLAVCC
jgi:hypothetical protein